MNHNFLPSNDHLPSNIPTTDVTTMQTTFQPTQGAMSIPKSPLKGLHSEWCQFGKIKQLNEAVQQVQDFIVMLASHGRCCYVMSNMTLTCNCLVNLSLKLDAEPSFLDLIVTELIVFACQKKEKQQKLLIIDCSNPH